MQKRIIYFYLLKDNSDGIIKTIPDHINYWSSIGLDGYSGGPFADRSGGLITFVSLSVEEASKAIIKDPFYMNNLVDQYWIKEWLVEEA